MSIPAVVLDASVAAAWLLPDEASEASRRVYVRTRRGSLVLHAPELWLWECGTIIASAVKLPTRAGSTGTIRPIDTMSISTASMMKGMAAWRLREVVASGAAVSFVMQCL